MMKFTLGTSFLLLTYFFYGFYINQYDLSVVPRMLKHDNPQGFYDYKGVVNVHTNYSIGSASPDFVIESAQLAGLDFVILTDLNPFSTSVPENYYGNLLLLSGGKYSYLDSRFLHYSATQNKLGENKGEAQIKIADALSQAHKEQSDSLMVMAHPYKLGYQWTGDLPEGLDGIEILNLKALSTRTWEKSKLSVFWSLLIYPFNSRLALIRLFEEPKEELDLWNRTLNAGKKLWGFSGAEASARALPFPGYPVQFPSYHRLFEITSVHVILKSELTGNFSADRQKIYKALKGGNFYFSFDTLGDPKGFNFSVDDRNRTYIMGEEISFKKDLHLNVKLPAKPHYPFEIRVIKDGSVIEKLKETQVQYQIKEAGVYRIEVRVRPPWPFPDAERWLPWIYSNPVFIK
ncbi:MAG: hypothetical protein ACLGGX_00895 [Bdellovibrionia bacterium]